MDDISASTKFHKLVVSDKYQKNFHNKNLLLTKPREAIVFYLEVLEAGRKPDSSADDIQDAEVLKPSSLARMPMHELRARALSSASSSPDARQRTVAVQNQAEAIWQYALKLAAGVCESCLQPAPSHGKNGPYLQVHHLHRLSDAYPYHSDAVAAVYPNCHREIHVGVDGLEKNLDLV